MKTEKAHSGYQERIFCTWLDGEETEAVRKKLGSAGKEGRTGM